MSVSKVKNLCVSNVNMKSVFTYDTSFCRNTRFGMQMVKKIIQILGRMKKLIFDGKYRQNAMSQIISQNHHSVHCSNLPHHQGCQNPPHCHNRNSQNRCNHIRCYCRHNENYCYFAYCNPCIPMQ